MFDDPADSPVDFQNGRLRRDHPEARLQLPEPAAAPAARNDLDSEASQSLHARLMSFYQRELDRQAENRAEMATDQDYFDSIQWSEEDARTLKARGQMPIVYNVISTAVNWVTGTEKRGRTDFRVLPRRKDASKPAERKTQLLKYLSDVNRSPFHRSRAFEDAARVGLGWLECGVQDDDDGEPVYVRYESWRNMLWDSSSTEMDLSDARYVMRSKWVDADVALTWFSGRAAAIREALVEADAWGVGRDDHGDDAMDSQEMAAEGTGAVRDEFHFHRGRIRLIEVWFRRPIRAKRLRGGDFNGDVYDQSFEPHAEAVASGQSIVVEKQMMRVHCAVMTAKALLYLSDSPYRHNSFPFTPIWAFRRGRDGMPYGLIRGLRGMQDDINKRASKYLFILSSNKVVMEEGAVDDLDAFLEEYNRPDGVAVVKTGKLGAILTGLDRELGAGHMELMSRSIAMIQQVSGVTDENMGRSTNATSGRAIQARQSQGSMATAGLFDNLRLAVQIHGEKELSLVEQYFSEEKSFRITSMRGSPEYIVINDGMPENDIIRTKADFVISEDDWRASIRQAQTEELFGLMQQLAPVSPVVVLGMLDLVVEGMDIPSREELVRRIRQATGMRDPDAEEPTPEEIQQQQQKAQAEALQREAALADVVGKKADAELKIAQAKKTAADAEAVIAEIASKKVGTQKVAIETAAAALAVPAAIPVADGVLTEAGFEAEGQPARDEIASDPAGQMATGDMSMPDGPAPSQIPPQMPPPEPRGVPAVFIPSGGAGGPVDALPPSEPGPLAPAEMNAPGAAPPLDAPPIPTPFPGA